MNYINLGKIASLLPKLEKIIQEGGMSQKWKRELSAYINNLQYLLDPLDLEFDTPSLMKLFR